MNANEAIEQIDKLLDEYESRIGMGTFVEGFDGVQQYMRMSREQMERLTPEDCSYAALTLAGFSYHLQRALNREAARAKWARDNIDLTVSGQERQFSGSWESQKFQAIKGDDYLRRLETLRRHADSRAERLRGLAYSAKHMSEVFKNLQMAKVMK